MNKHFFCCYQSLYLMFVIMLVFFSFCCLSFSYEYLTIRASEYCEETPKESIEFHWPHNFKVVLSFQIRRQVTIFLPPARSLSFCLSFARLTIAPIYLKRLGKKSRGKLYRHLLYGTTPIYMGRDSGR